MITLTSKDSEKQELLQIIAKLYLKKMAGKKDRFPLKLMYDDLRDDVKYQGDYLISRKGEDILKDFFSDIYSFYLFYWPYETRMEEVLNEREKYSGRVRIWINANCPAIEPVCYKCLSDGPFNKDIDFMNSLQCKEKSPYHDEIDFFLSLQHMFCFNAYKKLPKEFSFRYNGERPKYGHFGYFLLYDKKSNRSLFIIDDDWAWVISFSKTM